MKIQEQGFLLKRIETKSTKDCAILLKNYADNYGDEKGCSLYCIFNGDCNDDDVLLDVYIKDRHSALLGKDGMEIVKLFKKMAELERKSALAIYNNEDCIEVVGECTTINDSTSLKSLPEQSNDLFSLTHNKDLDCYDFILKQPHYKTDTDLAGILSWIHQLGVNCPQFTIRIGAMEEAKKPPIIQ